MRIAELFYSIQGEGMLVGVPSIFIRTSGCPLRCVWCDTPYTSWQPEGVNMSIEQILQAVSDFSPVPASSPRNPRHVVVTGGEPMIVPELPALCDALHDRGYHITIETAAIHYQEVFCDLVSLSPKLSNSTPPTQSNSSNAVRLHDANRLRVDVIRQFLNKSEYQLKFVIETPNDVEEVKTLLNHLPEVDASRVLLMPQARQRDELLERSVWLIELCKQHGWRYCPRVHIEVFGSKRGV
jgi:7-carboxy-7-deazaguanine synthase